MTLCEYEFAPFTYRLFRRHDGCLRITRKLPPRNWQRTYELSQAVYESIITAPEAERGRACHVIY
jgi:hypothetical protein